MTCSGCHPRAGSGHPGWVPPALSGFVPVAEPQPPPGLRDAGGAGHRAVPAAPSGQGHRGLPTAPRQLPTGFSPGGCRLSPGGSRPGGAPRTHRPPPRPAPPGPPPRPGGSGRGRGGPAHLRHGAKPRPPVSCPRSSPGPPGPRTATAAWSGPAAHTQRGPSQAGRARRGGGEWVRDPRDPRDIGHRSGTPFLGTPLVPAVCFRGTLLAPPRWGVPLTAQLAPLPA